MLDAYKAVFFDAGGTLLHPYPSVGEIYATYAAKHGRQVQSDEVEARFRSAWLKRDGLTHLASHSSGKVERQWWYELVRDVFDSLTTFENFDSFFDELYDVFARAQHWKLYPGVMNLLRHLKAGRKKIGIISNWDSRLLGICEGLAITPHVDFILASAVFGVSKPNPKIFHEALRLSGVDPAEAVHIGDSFEDDVKGASAAGLHAILIERHPRHRKLEGIRTIHDLQELMG